MLLNIKIIKLFIVVGVKERVVFVIESCLGLSLSKERQITLNFWNN